MEQRLIATKVPVYLEDEEINFTTPSRARKWIKNGKAKSFFNSGIFCVRLNENPIDYKRRIIMNKKEFLVKMFDVLLTHGFSNFIEKGKNFENIKFLFVSKNEDYLNIYIKENEKIKYDGLINTTAKLSQQIKGKNLSFDELLIDFGLILPRRKTKYGETAQSSVYIVDVLEKLKNNGFKHSTAFFGNIKSGTFKNPNLIFFDVFKDKNSFVYKYDGLKAHSYCYINDKLGYIQKENIDFDNVIDFLSGNIDDKSNFIKEEI